MTDTGDVIETPDGHSARVTFLSDTTMTVKYDDGSVSILPREPGPYTCKTCDEIVQVGERHEHGCPLEGDNCGSRRCNETGMCQA
jgi:hypothetical protein